MKKLFSLVGVLLILGTFLVVPKKAEADIWTFTGHWINYYGGNLDPIQANCRWHISANDCEVGDTRPLVVE